MKTGDILGTWALISNKQTWGERFLEMGDSFRDIPFPVETADYVCMELLMGGTNSRSLNSIGGVFVQHLPKIILNKNSYVTSSEWKAYVRRNSTTKDASPKGMDALGLCGIEAPTCETDDEADAILIGKTWLEKYEKRRK